MVKLTGASLGVISESREVIEDLRRLAHRLEVYVDDLEEAANQEGDSAGDETEPDHQPG